MLHSWFQYDAGKHLQKFYEDVVAGKRPKLLLSSPPQHGKSLLMGDFVSWVAGKNPDLHTMFASYSDALGERTNSDLQRIYDGEAYQRCFYDTKIPDRSNISNETRYKRNVSYMQYVDHDGDFRNTTVNGQITGFGLDFGIIDDPIKGRAEASPLANRDKTWNWLTDDFFSRFSDKSRDGDDRNQVALGRSYRTLDGSRYMHRRVGLRATARNPHQRDRVPECVP
jgi:hypothetical protein